MLRAIERATRQTIEPMTLPSVDAVNARRVAKFLEKIDAALGSEDLTMFRELVERFENERNVPMAEIAAALAKLVQGKTPLLLPQPAQPERTFQPPPDRRHRDAAPEPDTRRRPHDGAGPKAHSEDAHPRHASPPRPPRERPAPDFPMQTFRIEVGHRHGVQPGNIVGAIANEADLESRYIGRIDIRDDHTLVDLPEGMPHELLAHLKKVRVAGQPLRMRPATDDDRAAGAGKRRPPSPRGRKPRDG